MIGPYIIPPSTRGSKPFHLRVFLHKSRRSQTDWQIHGAAWDGNGIFRLPMNQSSRCRTGMPGRTPETPPAYVPSSCSKSYMQNTGKVGNAEKGLPINHGNIGRIRLPWIVSMQTMKRWTSAEIKTEIEWSNEWGGSIGSGHLDGQLNTGTLGILGCTGCHPSTIPNRKKTKSFWNIRKGVASLPPTYQINVSTWAAFGGPQSSSTQGTASSFTSSTTLD